MKMNVTLRQLYGFKAVAELGNFTRAAQRLGTAQPALSVSIRELETALGVRLLDRTTRRVELTAAGREFLQSADKLIADLEHAVQNARDLTDGKRGRLTVAAPPPLAAMIVPAAIADYKKAFPGIDVHLIDASTSIIADKIRSGEADCAVGTFADSEEGLRREILFEAPLLVWCNAGSPLSRGRRVTWDELARQPLIAMTHDSSVRALVDRAYEAAGQPVRPAYEVSHLTTAIMMVEAGLGVSILPAYVCAFASAFKLVSRPLIEPQIRGQVAFVHASDRALSPAAGAFIRFLRARARAVLPSEMRDCCPPESAVAEDTAAAAAE